MVTGRELQERLEKVRFFMRQEGVKYFFVSGQADIQYLSGFDSGYALIGPRSAHLWVKDIYLEINRGLYGKRGYPFTVHPFRVGAIAEKVKKLGVNLLHAADMERSRWMRLRKSLGVRLRTADVVGKARYLKSRYEVRCIKKACGQAVAGMRRAREVVESGCDELFAVGEIEAMIRRQGSSKSPFGGGMLLAAGPHSANIHAYPVNRPIRRGPVIIDLGGNHEGYFSDMTRTLTVGGVDRKQKRLLEFVENLEMETIEFIEPGMRVSEAHDFVVSRLESQGLRMHHATGHGVGLEIHEAPYIGPGTKEVFEENAVFTIEPGIYLPKKYGIRFEDTVLMGKRKAKILTR